MATWEHLPNPTIRKFLLPKRKLQAFRGTHSVRFKIVKKRKAVAKKIYTFNSLSCAYATSGMMQTACVLSSFSFWIFPSLFLKDYFLLINSSVLLLSLTSKLFASVKTIFLTFIFCQSPSSQFLLKSIQENPSY